MARKLMMNNVENRLTSNYSPNGTRFTLYTGKIKLTNQCIIIKIDITNCKGIYENIISIGTDITSWDTTLVNIHIYYNKDNNILQFNIVDNYNKNFRVSVILSSNINSIKIDSSGFYLNEKLINSQFTYVSPGSVEYDMLYVLDRLSTTGNDISIGSHEGSVRSHATYDKVSIINY